MRFKHKCLFFACSFWSLATFGQTNQEIELLTQKLAQKLEGTLYVKPHRETAEGVLTGCGLEFAALKRDFSTKKGAPTQIVGSFYLRPNKNIGLAYALKLGVFDGFSFDNAIAPNNAFISAPNGKIPPKAIRVLAETPGFALFIGEFDDAVMRAYAAILDKSSLAVGFNRKSGQQDVTFLIDLAVIDTKMGNDSVVRQRSDEPVAQFVACTKDLAETSKGAVK
jgi:hypothetical protein